MKIPILSGAFTDNDPSFRTSYPKNLIPVIDDNGINNGYLKPADGIVTLGSGPGTDRGGINWSDEMFRVMGSKLVSVSSAGLITTLGDVEGSTDLVSMDYSFDRLAVASNRKLWYWDGTTLTQVTDVDLGSVIDMLWIDSYFMVTDGVNVKVTDLNDPTSFNPAKYGSSEIDPDPVKALLKPRDKAHVVNRYTIEPFKNRGGSGFPFQRIEGAVIKKGAIATHACCVYLDKVAFLGSGRNEECSIYIGANGSVEEIASEEIIKIIKEHTNAQLEDVQLEPRKHLKSWLLYVHFKDKTMVYDHAASQVAGQRVWFKLTSGLSGDSQYLARNFVYCYGKWHVGHPIASSIGTCTNEISSHWGNDVEWEFSTKCIYNNSNSAIIHEIELVALTGRVSPTSDPYIYMSYTWDGVTYSQEEKLHAGGAGDRNKRLVWYQQGLFENWRSQKFRGNSRAHISFTRLEATIEPLGA